jgi:organic radical activating enzyme
MNDYYSKVLQTRDRLNKIGKGFCLMKWMTQTLYLHMGDNHSCYHPRPHKIKLSDIKNNPSGLHNTAQKKEQRKIMLKGGRPEECYYCWNIEDLPGEHISDRMIHSTSDYALPELERVSKLDWDANVNPKHIEVSFGNACNFKCGYCCPQASSSWMSEIKQYGDYDITTKQYSIDFLKNSDFFHPEDDNPYVEAFWKWWPELKNDLKVFRITGGEPLMNANTFKLLDMIDTEPTPHLQLHCNSNLGMNNSIVVRFVDKIAKLIQEKKVMDFRLFTSIDTWGPRAEYMRHGLSCETWEQNMESYLNIVPNSKINFMCTFNVLCVTSFKSLLEKILHWRQEYPAKDKSGHGQRISFDIPYLKEPPHWMVNILPKEFLVYMKESLDFMNENHRSESKPFGFDEVEIQKFIRLKDYMETHPVSPEQIKRGRRDFFTFFNEHDKRRGTDFYKTFPDYVDFMKICENVYKEYSC